MKERFIRWAIRKMIRRREWPFLIKVFWEEFRKEYSEENDASSLSTIVETIKE